MDNGSFKPKSGSNGNGGRKSGTNGNGGTICCFALFSATSVADTTLGGLRHWLKKTLFLSCKKTDMDLRRTQTWALKNTFFKLQKTDMNLKRTQTSFSKLQKPHIDVFLTAKTPNEDAG